VVNQEESMGGESTQRATEEQESASRRRVDSRERLVRSAMELILEHHQPGTDPRKVFAFLTPGAVAERAGVSRGLIYHHWASSDPDEPEPFTNFLHTVTERLWQEVAVPRMLDEVAEAMPDNLSDLVTALAAYELDRLTGPDRAEAHAVLALSLFGVSQPKDTGGTIERLGELYTKLLAKLGREPVPPLGIEDLAISLMCLLDGFTLNEPALHDEIYRPRDWEPSVKHEAEGQVWTLFAIAAEAIVLRLTRPIEEPRDPEE